MGQPTIKILSRKKKKSVLNRVFGPIATFFDRDGPKRRDRTKNVAIGSFFYGVSSLFFDDTENVQSDDTQSFIPLFIFLKPCFMLKKSGFLPSDGMMSKVFLDIIEIFLKRFFKKRSR